MFNRLPFVKSPPTVAVVRMNGAIASGGRFGGATLCDAGVAPLLERAFTKGKPVAVALAVNSPGGSPVQSSLIGARIRRLAEKKGIPVFAFCEDVAASGGYWLACAADEIYADASSIIGSIGVISASFGLHEFIERHGIERRVHTAGEDKSMLDPFRPEREADITRLKSLQAEIHKNFIDHVQARRGARLTRDDLFTGEFWTGETARELGLIDGIGHLVPTMQARFGDKVKFSVVAQKRSFFARMGAPGAQDLANGVAGGLFDAVEDKAHWARFGQ